MVEAQCQPGRVDAAVARHRGMNDSNSSRRKYQCDVDFTMASRPVYGRRFRSRSTCTATSSRAPIAQR
jgi:hypothetical protein